MEKYNQYSRGQLIQKINFLESENKFLREYIRGTKEFKDFNKWAKSSAIRKQCWNIEATYNKEYDK